ncbi:class I SAM-dependent methyltransferase [Leptospira sp. WS39.C2]
MEAKVFDQMAKQYDTEDRIQLANRILDKLKPSLLNAKDSTLLDFGCGTGLLGLPLASDYKQVFLSDDSMSMLDVANFKIKSQGKKNAKTMSISELADNKSFLVDHILLSLVLLHIPDTKSILTFLLDHLKSSGKLFIVDFIKNEKVSHPKIHNGFHLNELEKTLQSVGYKSVSSQIILEEKKVFMNEDATLFLLIAEK